MQKYDEIIKNINILLADDDEDYMMMTYAFLKQMGYNVDRAYNGKMAIEMLETNKYQIALLDYYMPEFTGEEVVKKIRESNKELVIILQTGFSGQKPPIETMKTLNIQNYYDKTEGIDRLNLELISAVRIFAQQNEIELTKYKSNAIGNLMASVAQEIKVNLLSISAGIELTNMLITDNSNFGRDKAESLSKYYSNNRDSLERIDKILTSLINQSTENSDYVLSGNDIYDIIDLITRNISKVCGVKLNIKMALKPNSYVSGGINDTIFVLCELLRKIMNMEEKGSTVTLSLSEDESYWFFTITSKMINEISNNDIILISSVMKSIKNAIVEKEDDDKIVIKLAK